MKVTIYGKSANHPRFEQLLMKFATGVIESGDEAFLSYDEQYYPCDVAVIFGSWKDRPDTHHRVKNEIVKKAKNFIVLETPLIGRGPVHNVMPDVWYRVGLNGFLNDTGNFNNKHKTWDRWDLIRKNLGIELKAYNDSNKDSPIIVALQLPGDASLRGASIEDWAVRTVQAIRTQSNRKIIVRTPQLERQYKESLQKVKMFPNVEFQTGTKENLIPTLESAHCAVTYSSGFAIDALINGCPVVACSPSNFAYDICPNTVDMIDQIKKPNRDQWLFNLSYAQWHESEIERGLPWRHLKQLIS